jgi:hypothetical protein
MNTSQTEYQLLADLIVLIHLLFVVFAVAGGLLIIKLRRLVWLHLIAVAWAATVEFSGWICPLTPLEIWLREKAGEGAYRSDFIAHYLVPLLYPAALTRQLQIALGLIVILVNLAIYSCFLRSRPCSKKGGGVRKLHRLNS